MTLTKTPDAYHALAIKEAPRSAWYEILKKGPGNWLGAMGEFRFDGWIFRQDINHSGLISTTPDVVAKYGFTDNKIWVEEDLDFFHVRQEWKGEFNEGADPAEYPDEYAEELAFFKNQRFCHISHCFHAEDSDGMGYQTGDLTPFGIIGTQEFTCWWNGIPFEMLAECDIDSWCDG